MIVASMSSWGSSTEVDLLIRMCEISAGRGESLSAVYIRRLLLFTKWSVYGNQADVLIWITCIAIL